LKLREMENSLYKTLKTAEDTGANVIGQARQAAELHVRESQFKAEAMLNEAKSKAKDVVDESDQRAKEIIADMEDRLRALADSYKRLESTRDDLISEMKRLASDTLDRVERAKANAIVFDADQHLNQVRRETKKIIFPNHQEVKAVQKPAEETVIEKPIPVIERTEKTIIEKEQPVQETLVEVPVQETPQPRKVQKSFFDEIG